MESTSGASEFERRLAAAVGLELEHRGRPGVPPEADVPGLEVKRDGVVLGRAVWGSPTPVDAGDHVIEAVAPGKQRWSKTIVVDARPTTLLVTVPKLLPEAGAAAPPAPMAPVVATPAPAAPAPEAPVKVREGGWSTQRWLGVATMGVGVAGVTVGSIFGLRARSKNEDSEAHCDGNTCDQTGVALRDDALDSATVSTVGFGVGAAALVGGVVLFATAPSKDSTVGVTAKPNQAGISWKRVW